MSKNDETVRIDDREALERFFQDLHGRTSEFLFAGVEAAVEFRSGWAPRAVFGAVFGALGAAAGGRHQELGHFLELALPRPVPADFQLRSREEVPAERTGFDERFEVQTSDPVAVREYFAHGLGDLLTGLGPGLRVHMTDERLSIGPLPSTPADAARVVAEVIAALPAAEPEGEPAPDFEQVASEDGGFEKVAKEVDPVFAEMAKTALASAGIPARVEGAAASGVWGGAMRSAAVVVPSSRAEEARAVLAELAGSATDAEPVGNARLRLEWDEGDPLEVGRALFEPLTPAQRVARAAAVLDLCRPHRPPVPEVDAVAALAHDPGRWAEGQKAFEAVRELTEEQEGRRRDEAHRALLFLAENTARTAYEASGKRESADEPACWWIAACARRFADHADRTGLEDALWKALVGE